MAASKDEKYDANDCSDIIIDGFLEKQSSLFKQFRKRWTALKDDDCLYLYKEQNISNSKPTEIIDLKLFKYIKVSTKNEFELISNGEFFKKIFMTKSVGERNKWLNCIKNVNTIKVIKNPNHDIIKIKINIVESGEFNDKFVIYSFYLKEEKMHNIFTKITKKYYPINLKIEEIYFCVGSRVYALKPNGNDPITRFNQNDLINGGLTVKVKIKYKHNIIHCDSISCEYMNKLNSNQPLHCPIYFGVKENYEFNKENLKHLNECTHFKNEYNDKPACKYNDECKAFIRMENGRNRMDDECHMKIYRHPPRNRNVKLSKNIHSLIINKTHQDNHPLYKPTYDDKKKYNYNDSDGYLWALINEVIRNGHKYDLCLQCRKNDECKHNEYSILQIVDDKMEHIRHKSMNKPLRRDHMLSLILYTGCDCNYSLCASQRNGDYNKWKWFDLCLYNAISLLSYHEDGEFTVFSGLNGVQLQSKQIKSGYFATFVSSSWKKEVAFSFVNGDGMIIQIDKHFKNSSCVKCCDVSWISRFPDELEILFARSLEYQSWNNFSLSILDSSNGVQTVSLSAVQKLDDSAMDSNVIIRVSSALELLCVSPDTFNGRKLRMNKLTLEASDF